MRAAFAILLTVVACSSALSKPLPIRAWQIYDWDMPHIERLVDMAGEQQVNRIQLCGTIGYFAEDVLSNPQRAKDINTICRWAHEKGIRVDMWTHELASLPKEFQKDGHWDLDNPKLWEFVQDRYRKLFTLVPALDGLVLTLAETDVHVYLPSQVGSSTTPSQRVAQLVENIYQVCKPLGKDLTVRTFSTNAQELRDLQQGLINCKADITVMTKCVPIDWQPYFPYNPAIGDVGGRRQIVEFDLGNEYTGLSTVPYINIDYLKRHLDYDLTKNISGAVLRVERFAFHAVDTPNQAVIDVFTSMLRDPSLDPHKLFSQWLSARYGADAAPYLYSALMRTEPILNKAFYALGFFVTNHTYIPYYDYVDIALREMTTAQWDPSTKPIEKELFNPTQQTIRQIDAEKDEALKLVDLSLADIEKARPYLKPADYSYFVDAFERERSIVVVWRAWMDVYFGIKAYKRSGSDVDREYVQGAADRLAEAAEANKTQLIKMITDARRSKSRTLNLKYARDLVDTAHKVTSEQHPQGVQR